MLIKIILAVMMVMALVNAKHLLIDRDELIEDLKELITEGEDILINGFEFDPKKLDKPKKLANPSSQEGTIRENVLPLLNNQSAPVQYELSKVVEIWDLTPINQGGKGLNATLECFSTENGKRSGPVTIAVDFSYSITAYGSTYYLDKWNVKK